MAADAFRLLWRKEVAQTSAQELWPTAQRGNLSWRRLEVPERRRVGSYEAVERQCVAADGDDGIGRQSQRKRGWKLVHATDAAWARARAR